MYYRQAPAQALTKLMSPEDILAHPCGEYVLDQLQRGVSPDKVVDVLLQEYLVVVDSMRLRAYRRLREQLGDYWTLEHLELHHWEYLYQQMPVEADGGAGGMRAHHQKLRGIHSRFCEHADIAEELVPMRVFETFYTKHGQQAALPHQYPGAALVKDALAAELVEAYSSVLRGRTLPALGSLCMAQLRHVMGRQVVLTTSIE